MKEPTCEERVDEYFDSRMDDLRKLWAAEDFEVEDLGSLYDYGLCFDYVAPNTFKEQAEGYFRYQLSTGGPGDEFRFYTSGPRFKLYRIEYWLLDWFDGAHIDIDLSSDNGHFLAEFFQNFFVDTETVGTLYDEAGMYDKNLESVYGYD